MKKFIILVIAGLFIACSVTSRSSNLEVSETNSLYWVEKIKKQKYFYIIYAVRDDSTFKIISDISNEKIRDCEVIEEGKGYLLDLKVVFPTDSLFGKPVAPNLGIRGYSIGKDQVIMTEMKSHNKIYTALNLTGLCFKQ